MIKRVIYQSLKTILILAVVLALLTAWNIYDVNTIAVNNYEIYSYEIPSNFNRYKIAFISDFHNAEYVEKTAQKLGEIKPDIILVGGDMVNLNENTYENTLSLFEKTVEIAPTYMVMGNHEIFHDKLEDIKKDFINAGVTLLHDEGVKLQRDASYIKLYGMKDPAIGDDEITEPGKLDAMVAKAKRGADANTFSLMVMHRANMFDMVYDTGYNLVLAGHIHGGVVRLPFLGGMFTPERDQWFPAYTKGMYSLGKSNMIVSAGMDKLKDKPRVFNGPEIVVVTLKKG